MYRGLAFTTAMAFGAIASLSVLLSEPAPARADHNSLHTTPCNAPNTVGGGQFGNSPGPVGPPDSLGWDVGSGQCNGSFTTTTDMSFPSDGGGGIELGLRIEQRRVGQVQRIGGNEYQVELGNDTTPAPALNRAWWNFQHSIAYDGDIDTLDALTFTIRTDAGPNLPSAPSVDMLAIRGAIDDRNNQPNSTSGFVDLYQTSQNPEFGWFTVNPDTDANNTGAFDYDVEGAWTMTLRAEKDGQTASVSICVHTPNAQCLPDHFACYRVHELSRLPKDLRVDLADQFGSEDGVELRRAVEICAPTDKNGEGILNPAFHLVCYDVKARERVDADVQVTNQITSDPPQELRVRGRMTRVCVPSLKEVLAN